MTRSAMGGVFRVTDEMWAKFEPLIPPRVNTHKFGGGRPPTPDRDCLDAIFFRLRTGCQWKALSATGICAGSTAHDRFQRWGREGVFRRFWEAGLLEYDGLRGLDWSWLSVDGAMNKAPLGGGKNRQKPHRSRQVRRQAVGAV